MWKFKVIGSKIAFVKKIIFDKICVVENLADMWVIKSANIYKGHYHILGGTLNSTDNYEPKKFIDGVFLLKE